MLAFYCGVIFGLVYEAFRLFRRIFPFKSVTFICDVLFFILAAFAVLNISLFLGNYVRIYTIIGFGAGVFAYIQTLGRLVSMLELLFGSIIKGVMANLFKMIAIPFRAFVHKITSHFGKINDFLIKRAKKALSLLQFRHQKLYNSKRNITTSIDDNKNGENFGGKYVIHAKINRSK